MQYGGGCIVGGGRGYKEISLRRGEILAAITVFLAILAATRLILLYRSSCIPFFPIPLQQPAVSLSPSLSSGKGSNNSENRRDVSLAGRQSMKEQARF